MTEEEIQVLKDRLEYVRNKMMIYSNTGHPDYLALVNEEKEIIGKLDDLILNHTDPYSTKNIISTFIVNQLGINLCAVKSINIDRQEDGQIKEIKIEFTPSKD